MAACTGSARRFFDGILRGYRRWLAWVLDNPGLTLIMLLLTIALNVVHHHQNSQGIFPAAGYGSDRGRRAGAAGRVVRGDEQFDPADW